MMPMRAPKPCSVYGCPERIAADGGRFCEKHEAQQPKRPSAAARLYGRRWQRARLQFLRQNPLCVACEGKGRVVAAEVVDHVRPHRGDVRVFWDEGNWQPLCKRCHDRKTAREGRGEEESQGRGGNILVVRER